MDKDLSDNAVQRQRRTNANPANHKAELVIQRIGQNAAQIILDHGKEDGEAGHNRPNPN